jgi:hypothetical protein
MGKKREYSNVEGVDWEHELEALVEGLSDHKDQLEKEAEKIGILIKGLQDVYRRMKAIDNNPLSASEGEDPLRLDLSDLDLEV